MSAQLKPAKTSSAVWIDSSTATVAQLEALCEQQTDAASVPMSGQIAAAARTDGDAQSVKDLQQEWARVLLDGAGAVVIRQAVDDISMLDAVGDALLAIIARESAAGGGADHFAGAGSNTRLWNAHEKLCLENPALFARYNANDVLSLVCHAWLGPAYQITAQANIVHPGGRAQVCHRDYHMGFQRPELLTQYPAHVHALSPVLTLQGAIAHCDMPIESGPTQLLPFSQSLLAGYVAVAAPDIVDYFSKKSVQLELNKGDMLFFNPALMHAAGDNNTTDVERFANLLQIGSAYGRTLELLDRVGMCVALYPELQKLMQAKELDDAGMQQVVEACAEGYAFPANLDLQPPVGGLSPTSQQDIMLAALRNHLSPAEFTQQVHDQQALKRSS